MEIPVRHQLATIALQQMVSNIPLTLKESQFVMEYSIDHNHRRAARAIGMPPDRGIQLLTEDNVSEAVRMIWIHSMKPSHLSASTLKEEMYKLYEIALQEGNLSQAGKQLDMLAKHADIDAYAAQKVSVAADAEIAKRLKAGRARAMGTQVDTEEVSFL